MPQHPPVDRLRHVSQVLIAAIATSVLSLSAWAQNPPPRSLPPDAISPGERAAEPRPPQIVGTVVKIEDRQVVLKLNDADRDTVVLSVPLAAEVVLNGEEADLDALKPGDTLRIQVSQIDSEVAQRVVAARVDPDAPDPGVKVQGDRPMRTDERARTQQEIENPDRAGMGVVVAATPAEGVLITDVQLNGPADQAGVLIGDYILALGEVRVKNPQALLTTIQRHEPGDRVMVSIWRSGQTDQLAVSLVERAASPDIIGRQGLQTGPWDRQRSMMYSQFAPGEVGSAALPMAPQGGAGVGAVPLGGTIIAADGQIDAQALQQQLQQLAQQLQALQQAQGTNPAGQNAPIPDTRSNVRQPQQPPAAAPITPPQRPGVFQPFGGRGSGNQQPQRPGNQQPQRPGRQQPQQGGAAQPQQGNANASDAPAAGGGDAAAAGKR